MKIRHGRLVQHHALDLHRVVAALAKDESDLVRWLVLEYQDEPVQIPASFQEQDQLAADQFSTNP